MQAAASAAFAASWTQAGGGLSFFLDADGGFNSFRFLLDAGRWRRVDRTLSAVARGEQDLPSLLARARSSAPPAARAGALGLARVSVSNDISENSTVVEVVTQDRVGLLHDITAVLRDFALDLIVARIATRHDMASDTFYVVDQRGRKLPARRVKALQGRLEEALITPEERTAAAERASV